MTYSHSFLVQATQAGVARFHTEASSLGAITPPLMPMRLHYAPERMADGGEMAFTMWLGPIPVRWVASVQDVSGSGFVDRQKAGPFDAWAHRHTFSLVDHGTTKVVDEVEAELKRHPVWGPVGLAMWLGLPLLFAYRGWRTRRLLKTPASSRSPKTQGD